MGELLTQQFELTPPEAKQLTPYDFLELAIRSKAEPESLKQLMDLRDRYEANEARKAFVDAKARFAAEDIAITRDKENKQYGSRYTSLGNLVNTVRPYLGKHGFEARWEVDQANGIRVTCILTHAQGHSERVSMTVPPDTSGAKNPVQQIKSSITYGRNLTFESVCGLASTDGSVNLDDDGNGSGPSAKQFLSDERFCELKDAIAGANNENELKRIFFGAIEEAKKIGDVESQQKFSSLKNKRYREIQNASR